MARNIFIVNATQVITSQANPLGLLSVVDGFPKQFDSSKSPYNGDVEKAKKAAKAEYHNRLGTNYADTNASRVMTTVTLETADGFQMLKESVGSLPEEQVE